YLPAVAALISLAGCSATVARDPVYRETEIRQARPRLSGERFDSQESDANLQAIFSAADMKAERAVGDVPRDEKFISHFWEAKRRILEQEYEITWKSPAELNPQIRYANYGQPEVTAAESQALRDQVQSRLSPSESISGILREFEGDVGV